MAFNIISKLQIQAPTAANFARLKSSIKQGIGSVTANIKIDIARGASQRLDSLNKKIIVLDRNLQKASISAQSLGAPLKRAGTSFAGASTRINTFNTAAQKADIATKRVITSTNAASTSMKTFGQQTGIATKRFASFTIAAGALFTVVRGIRSGIGEAIEFQDQLVRLSQVTKRSVSDLSGLSQEVTRLSTTLGVSSKSIIGVSRILAQAGLSANETRSALEALAKTELAPTFTDINKTAEGAIAIMNQFGIEANQLDQALGALNAVSANFAVESDDLITVVRKAGGVFRTAAGDIGAPIDQLNQLIALFTAVRSTTRESADSIGTGFKTIFTRIRRSGTIEQLEDFGVKLTEIGEGGERLFVGPFEAVRRLNAALSELDPRDIVFGQIIEELGGLRQTQRLIPLIQEFGKAQAALGVAQAGTTSLTEAAARAQESLLVRLTKVKEEFLDLFRVIADNQSIKAFVDITLNLATAAIRLAKALEPLIPLLVAATTIRAAGFAGQLFRGVGKPIVARQRGGIVPGRGRGDTVPAVLEPGEFVIRKKAVEAIGKDRLERLNKFQRGGFFARVRETVRPAIGRFPRLNKPQLRAVEEHIKTSDPLNAFLRTGVAPTGQSRRGLVSRRKELDKAFNSNKVRRGELVSSLFRGISQVGLLNIFGPSPGSTNFRATPDNVQGRAFADPGFLSTSKSLGRADASARKSSPGIILKINKLARGLGALDLTVIGASLKRGFKKGKNFDEQEVLLPRGRRTVIGRATGRAPSGAPIFDTRILARGGFGGEDSVSALLTPGEFVINKRAARRIGRARLEKLNQADKIRGFAHGGIVKRFQGGGRALPSNAAVLSQVEARVFPKVFGESAEAVKKSTKTFTDLTGKTLAVGFGLSALVASLGEAETSTEAAVQGGLSLAAAGAQLGIVLGPIGIVAGSLIGGLIGATSAAKDFDKKVREAKFSESIENANKELQDFISGQTKVVSTQARAALDKAIENLAEEFSNISAETQDFSLSDVSVAASAFGSQLLASAQRISTGIIDFVANIPLPALGKVGSFVSSLATKLDNLTGNVASTAIQAERERKEREAQVLSFKRLEPVLIQTKNKLLDNVSSLAEFETSSDGLGKSILNQIAIGEALQNRLISETEARQKLEEEITKELKSRAEAAKLADAFKSVQERINNSLESLNNFAAALQGAALETQLLRDAAQATGQAFEGQITAGGPSRLAEAISLPATEQTAQQFQEAVELITRPLGDTGKELAKFVIEQRNAVTKARGIVQKISETGTGIDFRRELIGQLREANIGKDIREGILLQIEAIGGEKGVEGAFPKLRDNFSTAFDKIENELVRDVTSPLKEAASVFDKELGEVANAIKRNRELLNRIAAEQAKVAQFELNELRSEAERRARATGRPVSDFLSVAEQQVPFQAQLEQFTRPLGLAGKSAFDVSAIFDAAAQSSNNLKTALEQEAKSTEEITQKQSDIVKFSDELGKAKSALELLTKAGERTAAAQQRLSELQEQEQSRFDIFLRLAGASNEELARLNKEAAQALVIRQAAQRGIPISALPEQVRVGGVRALQGTFGQFRSPAFGGLTGRDVLRREVAPLGFAGIPGEAFGATAAEQREIQTLENSLADALKTATDAQKGLVDFVKLQQQVETELFNQSTDTFKNAVDKFVQSEAARRRLVGIEEELGQITPITGAAEELRKGLGLEDIRTSLVVPLAENRAALLKLSSVEEQLVQAQRRAAGVRADPAVTGFLGRALVPGGALTRGIGATTTFTAAELSAQELSTLTSKLGISFEELELGLGRINEQIPGLLAGGATQEQLGERAIDELLLNLPDTIVAGLEDSQKQLREELSATGLISPDIIEKLTASPELIQKLEVFDGLTRTIEELSQSQLILSKKIEELNFAKGRATGGTIFRNQGTDTVPAMLTPGEFVVNRRSSQANIDLLRQINSKKSPLFLQGGGPVLSAAEVRKRRLEEFEEQFRKVREERAKRVAQTQIEIQARIDAKPTREEVLARFNEQFKRVRENRPSREEVLSRFRDEFAEARKQRAQRLADSQQRTRGFTGIFVDPEAVEQAREARRQASIRDGTDPGEAEAERIRERLKFFQEVKRKREALLASRRPAERDEPVGGVKETPPAQRAKRGTLLGPREIDVGPIARPRFGTQKVGGSQTTGFLLQLPGGEIVKLKPGTRLRLERQRRSLQVNRRFVAGPIDPFARAAAGFGFAFGQASRGVGGAFGRFPFAEGGSVPGGGNTDSVSALLTPGEFVLNSKAVRSLGQRRLQRLNQGGVVQRLQEGGPVGPGIGGPISISSESIQELNGAFNTNIGLFTNEISRFGEFINSFSSAINTFSAAAEAFPQSISIEGNQQINVVINGIDSLRAVQTEIQQEILDKVQEELNALRAEVVEPGFGGERRP